jgi:hypothetical protein
MSSDTISPAIVWGSAASIKRGRDQEAALFAAASGSKFQHTVPEIHQPTHFAVCFDAGDKQDETDER